jgi:hypothetical protein
VLERGVDADSGGTSTVVVDFSFSAVFFPLAGDEFGDLMVGIQQAVFRTITPVFTAAVISSNEIIVVQEACGEV